MWFSLIWFLYELTMFGIRVSIGLSRILPTNIAYEIEYAKIIAAFFRISYCLHDLIRLNSIVGHVQTTRCTMVFFRWSLPLSIDHVLFVGIRILIGLSWLLHAHISYEIDTSKITGEFCRIFYYLQDFIRLNYIVCHVQTTRCTMMWFSMFDSDINWLCLKCAYWFLDTHIAYEIAI